ncbi:nucleotidyltransferase domain-containing protein [Bdellovibrionota bacterium FG-1]
MLNTVILDQDPIRVFLFGSRARGDETEGSDYDLLVIVPVSNVPGFRLAQQAHRHAFRGIPAPIDVVFFTEQKFEERKAVIGSLPETAVHEGKELYAA